MKYMTARNERKMSIKAKRGAKKGAKKHNATSTDGGGGMAACRCVGGTKSKGHGESHL